MPLKTDFRIGTKVRVIRLVGGEQIGVVVGGRTKDGYYVIDLDGKYRTVHERYLSEA